MSQTQHLTKRNGVFYYRRRVPTSLVAIIGKVTVQESLGTGDLKEAKRLTAILDVRWDARFQDAENALQPKKSSKTCTAGVAAKAISISPDWLAQVINYVERSDKRASQCLIADPPESETQRAEMTADAQIGLGILRDRDDPRADELVYGAAKEVLDFSKLPSESLPSAETFELFRRGLMELANRKIARLADDYSQPSIDTLFQPRQAKSVTFSAVADQHLEIVATEGSANDTSKKWIDKQSANVALLNRRRI